MVRITENLIRSRAEHNEGQLTNLEEVSLHQQDIERIEYIDKWCRDLKILYLQSNLIPKIENVGRLKKLEYINLALNNIERVENLEACESLKKLDLTVNFVRELTSIECLSQLQFFEELFLTGNPCTEYEYYKEYVIATLQHLKYLDGQEISRSDRLRAEQVYDTARKRVLQQQTQHLRNREKEKEAEQKRLAKKADSTKPGFDGRWYTDINESDKKQEEHTNGDPKDPLTDEDKKFWKDEVPFTPESRVEVHEQMKKQRARGEKEEKDESIKRERRLVTEDGRILNVNEGKLDFTLEDDEKNNKLVLNLETYRYMDTSLMDIDVQPMYVRATIKGKVFQLVLPEPVNADSSSARRSQLTGHLMVDMPKAREVIRNKKNFTSETATKTKSSAKPDSSDNQLLDVEPRPQLDLNIVKNAKPAVPLDYRPAKLEARANSPDFIDDPDVPPLE